MAALRKPPIRVMTVAEFLTWASGDPSGRAWQLIDGEPVAMAPGSDNHGSIQADLGARLWQHLAVPGSRRRVVTVPLLIGAADDITLDSIGFSVNLAALYRTTTLAAPEGNVP